ncbi:hypothetical protein BDA96_06G160300 [Sorghum bicolor]|jgi:hypothetical protein|uniref:Embryo sac development arrest 6 n=1 Tax=Sorghum bicolor TaxID=4558 RepID=A0A921QT87_SORBI|nr:hypothetical protein BDA96_06G160300 [Sorghum bicolor]
MSLSEKLEAARVALGKRKERERELQAAQAQQAQPLPVPAKAEPWKPAPVPARAAAAAAAGGGSGNKLLAGHLAHEFLAHGTLLGRRIEPSRGAPGTAPARAEPDPKRRYAEVSWLLMASGAHVPGVVNPTQLGRWLQIKD